MQTINNHNKYNRTKMINQKNQIITIVKTPECSPKCVSLSSWVQKGSTPQMSSGLCCWLCSSQWNVSTSTTSRPFPQNLPQEYFHSLYLSQSDMKAKRQKGPTFLQKGIGHVERVRTITWGINTLLLYLLHIFLQLYSLPQLIQSNWISPKSSYVSLKGDASKIKGYRYVRKLKYRKRYARQILNKEKLRELY